MKSVCRSLFPFLLTLCCIGSASAKDWGIDFDRLGPLKIGMTTAQVIKAKGNLQPSRDGDKLDPEIDSCAGVYLPGAGIYLELDSGRLEEIQTSAPKFKMANGIGVGSTFADIVRTFDTDQWKMDHNIYDEDLPLVTIKAPSQITKLHPTMPVGIQFTFKRGPLVGGSKITEISIGAHFEEGCD